MSRVIWLQHARDLASGALYARVSDGQWIDRIDSTLTADVDAAQVPRLPTIDLDAERLEQFNALAHAMLGADFSSALGAA